MTARRSLPECGCSTALPRHQSLGVCSKRSAQMGFYGRFVGIPIRALCFLSWFCRISDTALCTFWSRSGSFHGAAVERSGTAGGMKRVLPVEVEEGLQCAVGCVLGSGVAGMRAVRAVIFRIFKLFNNFIYLGIALFAV